MDNEIENKNLRIRKLTPRECLRLQGQNDEDISRILSTVSESAAYKQRGNSIRVNVLVDIFRELL